MKYRISENELGFWVDEWSTKSVVFGDIWRKMPLDWKPLAGPFDSLLEAESHIEAKHTQRRIGAQPFFKVVKEIEV